MIKALVVGCGQIGALYDIDKDEMVLSHAKAYHLSKDVDLVKVIDKDISDYGFNRNKKDITNHLKRIGL